MEENNNEVVYKLRKRWLLFGLPFTYTVYYIKEDVITIDAGFFKTTEDDCYMYKVQDVKLERSLLQRMAGLGTVVCFTGDTTNPQLLIQNIKNSKEVKDYILKQLEVARIKRRTINMVDIGAGVAGDLDGDGFIDQMN